LRGVAGGGVAASADGVEYWEKGNVAVTAIRGER